MKSDIVMENKQQMMMGNVLPYPTIITKIFM